MAEKKPETKELTPRQQQMRTLGLFLLVFVGPLLALRAGCVSYREVCEREGGRYGVVRDVHTCSFAHVETSAEGHACPSPYRYSESGSGCNARAGRTGLPVLFRWDAW